MFPRCSALGGMLSCETRQDSLLRDDPGGQRGPRLPGPQGSARGQKKVGNLFAFATASSNLLTGNVSKKSRGTNVSELYQRYAQCVWIMLKQTHLVEQTQTVSLIS